MNLKMSDFLFEEKSIQELEGDNESEGRLELRSELSDDHIKGGPELLLADVHKVAEEIASHIFALSSNAVNNAKIRHAAKGKSKKELTPEEIEAIKKADKILDLPLGVIDSKLLIDLFKKNYSVGYAGKIEGRAHLNPVQLKRDAKQVAGGTPIDLEESKKMQMVFMFLSNENSEIVQCKGKAIVFAIPALGANCIKGIDYYTQLYPDVTEETPILYHIPKAAFFLLPFDEFDDFQTNKLQTIKRCLQKEKTEEQVEQEESGETNESFVYQRGLSTLLMESAATNSGATSSGHGGDSSQTDAGGDDAGGAGGDGDPEGGDEESAENETKDDNSANKKREKELKAKFNEVFDEEADKICNEISLSFELIIKDLNQNVKSKDKKGKFQQFFASYTSGVIEKLNDSLDQDASFLSGIKKQIKKNAEYNLKRAALENKEFFVYCDPRLEDKAIICSSVKKSGLKDKEIDSLNIKSFIEHEVIHAFYSILKSEKTKLYNQRSYGHFNITGGPTGDDINVISQERYINEVLLEIDSLNSVSDFCQELLNYVVLNYEKTIKVTENDKRLIEKYKEKFGEKGLTKLIMYTFFFADDSKSLSLLLRENIENNNSIITEGVFDFIRDSIKLLFKGQLESGVSLIKEFCKYFFSIDSVSEDDLKPFAFGDSIEEKFEESLTNDELKNLQSFKARKACELLTTSVYRDLIEKSDKSGKPIRDFVHDAVTVATAGIGATAIATAGGAVGVPLLLGGLLITNETSGVVRGLPGVVRNIFKRNPEGLDNKVAQQFNKKIKQAGMEVDIAEEIQSVFDSYKEIIKDIDELTESKSQFVHHTNSISSILKENDDTDADDVESEESAGSKKRQFKIIDEEEVVQILEGNGVQLFSADFDSERVYSSFMSKFNGILRKYAHIKIRNIKRRSVTKFLAHEQARSVTNQNAKVGQPACPILDIISRQMQSTGEEPVQALSSALNAINHSGGNMGMLLVLMMLTNPDGWGKLASSFQGDKNDAFQKILELMSGTINNKASAEELSEHVDENAVSKVEITEEMLKRVFALIRLTHTKSIETKEVVKQYDNYNEFKNKLSKGLIITNDISDDLADVDMRYTSLLGEIVNLTKRKEFDTNLNIENLVTDNYFMGTLIFQSAVYNIAGGHNQNLLLFISEANSDEGVVNIGGRHCLSYFYSNITDNIYLHAKTFSNIAIDELNDILEEERGPQRLSINLDNLKDYLSEAVSESYLRRLSLDIGFRDPVILNESEKDNIIDLRNEWRKLWNI